MASGSESRSMQMFQIGDTFGAAFVGTIFMTMLYGITILQTYMYFTRYPKDSTSIKALVLLLWALDTLHVTLVFHAIYHYLILNFANPLALLEGVWSLYASIGVNVMIALVTQLFYLRRIHALNGQRIWLTAIILLMIIAHFAFGIETMAEMLIKKQLNRLREITYIAALPFAILAVLSDVTITITLCALLSKKKTDFKSTNDILDHLMIYAINRCILTSIVAVVEIVTFTVLPNAFWFLGIDFIIGKLYTNSLLATLNSRKPLGGRGQNLNAEEDFDIEQPQIDAEVSFPVFRVGYNVGQNPAISDSAKEGLEIAITAENESIHSQTRILHTEIQ